MYSAKRMTVLHALCALGALVSPAYSQSPDIRQLLSGKKPPLTVEFKDMDINWHVITVSGPGEVSSAVSGIYDSGLRNGDPVWLRNVYYTKGESATLGGDVFLIAYQQKFMKIDEMAFTQSDPDDNHVRETIIPLDPNLKLTLLNLRNINSISDIQPFDLRHQIAITKRAADAEINRQSELKIRQLSYGIIQFMQDNDENFPIMNDPSAVQKAIMPFVKSKEAFYQVNTGAPYQMNKSLSNRNLSQIQDPTTMVVIYEMFPDTSGKRWVSYVDGHQKKLNAVEWAAAKKDSHIP